MNFIKYKVNYKQLKKPIFAVFFAVLLLANIPFLQNSYSVPASVSVVTIDLTGQPNTNDVPYGIDYDGIQYVYMTIFSQGAIVRIDKNTQTNTIFNNDVATSGQDWYSLAVDRNSTKIFITEKDTGRMLVFTPSSQTFATIPVPANIAGGVISYTSSYATNPHEITVSGGTCTGNTYQFGFSSFGEVKVTNGFVWTLIDYNYDFSSADNTCGANDVAFHGIVKINPNNNNVISRTAISGAENIRGVTVDAFDSTILWIADNTADKIYKFDTDILTVIETITLPAGSKARGIVDDGTNLYVALNKASGGNSKILKVVKATGVTSEIDTGASNTSTGTFEVDIASGYLFWSDQSGHIGSINLVDYNDKTFTNTVQTSSNHFGVVVDGNYWWAGQGSVKAVITPIPSSSGTTGGSNELTEHLKRPTIGMQHTPEGQSDIQLVDYGFTFDESCNGKQYQITNNWYTPFEKVIVETGKQYCSKIKVYTDADSTLHMVELALVPSVGERHNAETAISIYFDHLMNNIFINIRQNENIIDEDKLTVSYKPTECTKNQQNKVMYGYMNNYEKLCYEVTINNILFREKPFFEKVAITVIDSEGRPNTTYLNEGFDIIGKSLNPQKTDLMASSKKGVGLEKMVLIDKFTNTWINVNGDLYTRNNHGTWILLLAKEVQKQCDDLEMKVLERNNCNFDQMKAVEIYKAVTYLKEKHPHLFDTPFDKIDNVYTIEYPTLDKRTQTLIDNDMMWLRE